MEDKTAREQYEVKEDNMLAPWATRSRMSKGRCKPEEPCPIRTCFQRDRDRIVHSKAFRRLKHKTQVLLLPEGDHYRTRLTHTLEVSQISRVIARALSLNEDLVEAIALGHDLGHTPFGHMGERVLNKLAKLHGKEGFSHAKQSLRVVDVLEKDGLGLNLTEEVRDGILKHSKGQINVRYGFYSDIPMTLEGWVVRVADSVAYLNHDLDDALRAGMVTVDDLPFIVTETLGDRHSKRIGTIVKDIIDNSGPDGIGMSERILEAVEALRAFLYKNVYIAKRASEEEPKVEHLISTLFNFFMENPHFIPEKYTSDRVQSVIDFISGMTDRYAMLLFKRIALPAPWPHDPFNDLFSTHQ
ncbi:deoxyguanosinetriphosphate triphosphohydrolase [Thermovirga sp.]|uniref:deoxyguanosinetriphosphate triphosphohydrolase n=1 Tax=Thermovirga sp. TaxID=2699834 RepID=UPI0025F10CE7|nr:deoxyguanosinetriphosphate triphosphohydrolase [Thermovirga sp.]MBO8153962.1 deoxyguanosinetriphosphate triphosphohydrolase [Thermovirga sp.]